MPFVETLEKSSAAGKPLAEAWGDAARAAKSAAEATRVMTPKIGRARPLAERSVGHPDAGAVSLALSAETAASFLRESQG